MTYQVTQCGNGSLEITKEFFNSREEAMEYYSVTDKDSWFWDNYAIEAVFA